MARRTSKYLLFVDTNIYLDFYRYGKTGGVKSLTRLQELANENELITTEQVEMEFCKNRQGVLLHVLKQLEIEKPDIPPILSFINNAELTASSQKIHSDIDKYTKRLKSVLSSILKNPERNDIIYKTLREIFRQDSPYNVRRPKNERFQIRRLARKRFALGYPPRKGNDITIGDAINWESIIYSCQLSKKHVVIVSRDGDYGATVGKHDYLKDCLVDEFRERVGRSQNAVFTKSLVKGLKTLGIEPTQQEENAEADMLKVRLDFTSWEEREAAIRKHLDVLFQDRIPALSDASMSNRVTQNTETRTSQ